MDCANMWGVDMDQPLPLDMEQETQNLLERLQSSPSAMHGMIICNALYHAYLAGRQS